MKQAHIYRKPSFRAISFAAIALVCSSLSWLTPSIGHAGTGQVMFKCDGLEEKSLYSTFGTKMYQANDGWFFRPSDYQTLFELPQESLNFVSRVNGALNYRGIHLVVLPMLPRAIAGRDFVPNEGMLADFLYDPDFAAQQFDDVIASARQVGIDAINVDDILKANPSFDKANYYFKRDIHWTPEGARLIAQAVAAHIRSLQGDVEHEVEFETSMEPEPRLHKAKFNGVLNELCQSKIPSEEVRIYETKQKVGSLNELLGEDDAGGAGEPVHVVGSSYTDEISVYNFNGFLREYLKQNVGGFAVSGGSVDQSIYAWAQNANGITKKPKYLVWEFPDFGDLRKQTAVMNSSVVPAIVGDCSDRLMVANKSFGEDEAIELDLPPLTGKPDEYYLRYEFANRALTGFQLTYSYREGSVKTVSFNNPPRVSGLSQLYQALPAGRGAGPLHVSLKMEGGARSAGLVKLCRYPDAIFQPVAKSN
ncbi:hypothetical protein PYR71_28825 [Rhizobium sp. MC63]|uniref:Uncharacterized protein n=1 Tax=Rhizobium mulingense TaxID=3031128 RepID=A0ACC6N698_9HYPH|nr:MULTISPECIES: hypothetical protein [unclassified Rhizobium]MDF0700409.1 hypothetical protein [Rhizobium sp. MC63]MEA3521106.1 hypothetical protein [Rhizobium sp. MJ31]